VNPVRIKVCGLTRIEDVRLAGRLEVDAVGFVLWPRSPRAVTVDDAAALARALPPFTVRVGVFVAPTLSEVVTAVQTVGLGVVQLHDVADVQPFLALQIPLLWAAPLGPVTDDPVTPAGTTLLVDAHDPQRHGGHGRTIDWTRAGRLAARERLVLAGGLTAENVAAAIAVVRPYAVDVSSGVELTPGIKSARRMQAFVEAVRHVQSAPVV